MEFEQIKEHQKEMTKMLQKVLSATSPASLAENVEMVIDHACSVDDLTQTEERLANSTDFKSQLVSNYHFCYLNHVTSHNLCRYHTWRPLAEDQWEI